MIIDNFTDGILQGVAISIFSSVLGYLVARNKSITDSENKIKRMEKDTSHKLDMLKSSMESKVDNMKNKNEVQDQRIELLEKKSENYITREEFTQYMDAQKEIISRIDKNVDKIFERLV